MIALQSLKYKIFEWCIDTFTDKLINNFRIFKLNGTRIQVRDLRPGMHISTIILNITGWAPVMFQDCRIIKTTLLAIDYDEWDSRNILWDVQFTCAKGSGTGYIRDTSFDNHSQIQSWNTTEGTDELEFIL